MHNRRSVRALLIATTILATTAITGLAQSDSADIDIVINPDETPVGLSVSIQEGQVSRDGTTVTRTFDDATFSVDDQVISGAFTVVISEGRDPAPGWQFNISGTDFTNASRTGIPETTPDHSFSVENLSLFGVVVASTDGRTNDGIGIPLTSSPLTTTSQGLVSAIAGSGQGGWIVSVQADLTIPGDTPPGTYASTITVESFAAPGS